MPTEYEKFYSKYATKDLYNTIAYYAREKAIHLFGFGILVGAAINHIKSYAPLIEVGAGSGYWAYELQSDGIDIIATDSTPVDRNWYGFKKQWVQIDVIDAVTAVKSHPARTLLMVWPCYKKPWACDALHAYKGNTFIYCGEQYGGCTADSSFHVLLEQEWAQTKTLPLLSWSGIYDQLIIYTRKCAPQLQRK